MATIVLIIGVIFVFFVGLVSPKHAVKIQKETNKKAKKLKQYGDWFWNPITWWVNGSIDMSSKVINTVTEWGKKSHKKVEKWKK